MADVVFNFNSQWPNVQVVKVIKNPAASTAYEHGLGYPPMAIVHGGRYLTMDLVDCDNTYVYTPSNPSGTAPDHLVIYSLDVSTPFTYPTFPEIYGDVTPDESDTPLDLRNFLLHTRAVSPMVLKVETKNYTAADYNMTSASPLSYPTFHFGWQRAAITSGQFVAGRWKSVPLGGQSFPWMVSDGYTATNNSTLQSGSPVTDIGSIVTLRNPSVVTANTVNVSVS